MSANNRVERALERALAHGIGADTPPRLAEALHDAVFPGGARVRPRLVLAVAEACGCSEGPRVEVAEAAAAAVELLHCASLVHDDLPQFDDAPLRRGRPAIHVAHGPQLAILAGDGLIVAAFQALAAGCHGEPRCLSPLVAAVGAGVGAAGGIVAGQAWESEPSLELRAYHRAKTGALFEAAVRAGAIAGGGDPEDWAGLGRCFGEAYQVADDISDVIGDLATLGKPVGQDAVLDRPSATRSLGMHGAYARLEELLVEISRAIPACPGRERFEAWILGLCSGMVPARAVERRAVNRVEPLYLEAIA
ncbi:MAG: polyprenyl synthetase family protein [Myxococcales bacterium]|nr:polyprenyl synthetase family protein [Myxococcales bacterium]